MSNFDEDVKKSLNDFLETENSRLQLELNKKTIDYSELLEKYIHLQSMFNSAETSIEEALGCISELSKKEEREYPNSKISILRDSLQRKEQKIKVMQEKMNALTASNNDLSNSAEQLRSQLSKMQNHLSKMDQDFGLTLRKKDEVISLLRDEKQQLIEENNQFMKQVQEIDDRIEDISNKATQEKVMLENKVSICHKQIKDLTEEIEKKNATILHLESSLGDQSRKTQILSDENENHLSRIKSLNHELENVSQQLVNRVREAKDLEIKLIDAQQSVETNRKSEAIVKALEKELQKKDFDIALLRDQVESQIPKTIAKFDQSVQATLNIDSVKLDLFKQQNAKLKAELQRITKEKDTLENSRNHGNIYNCPKLEAEVERLKSNLKTIYEKEKKKASEIIQKDSTIETLKQSIKKLNERISKYERQAKNTDFTPSKLKTKPLTSGRLGQKEFETIDENDTTLLHLDKRINELETAINPSDTDSLRDLINNVVTCEQNSMAWLSVDESQLDCKLGNHITKFAE